MSPHGIPISANESTVIFLPAFQNFSRATKVFFVLPAYIQIKELFIFKNFPTEGRECFWECPVTIVSSHGNGTSSVISVSAVPNLKLQLPNVQSCFSVRFSKETFWGPIVTTASDRLKHDLFFLAPVPPF